MPYDKFTYPSPPQEALRDCSTGQEVKQITLSSEQMKDIGEKTRIIQTWEASSFFLKMVPSAFGKLARNTLSLSFKTLTK